MRVTALGRFFSGEKRTINGANSWGGAGHLGCCSLFAIERVESLKPLYPGQVPVLRSIKKTSAREVFRWKNGKNQVVVVVTRPYWLSFYASSGSVVWVTTMIKEAGCD